MGIWPTVLARRYVTPMQSKLRDSGSICSFEASVEIFSNEGNHLREMKVRAIIECHDPAAVSVRRWIKRCKRRNTRTTILGFRYRFTIGSTTSDERSLSAFLRAQ